MVKHLNIKVFGLVQGVYFRRYSFEKAQELAINGFVRNEPDGSVYIEAEGEPELLKKFTNWCRVGSPGSRVEKVTINEAPLKNFRGFVIETSPH